MTVPMHLKTQIKKNPRVEHNKRVRAEKKARQGRANDHDARKDSVPISRIPWQERNPHDIDYQVKIVDDAHRHDDKMARVRAAQQAERNPHFACPDCGATVRKGAKGGLWDVRLRTGHWLVCAALHPVVTPEEKREKLEHIRNVAPPIATDKPGVHGQCEACGFREEKCRC